MTRHTPATRPTAQPTFRPTAPARTDLHYLHNAATAEVIVYTPAQVAAKQRQDAILYARWRQRHAAQAARDRKARRFLLGLGITVGVGILAALAALAWLIVHALAGIGLPLIAAVIAAVAGLGLFAGHRCITVVQHWH